MKRVLVATNNFWVGGRETYLASWLEALESVEFSLLASSVQSGAPGLARFADRVEVRAGSPSGRWKGWLAQGGEMIHRRPPAVIWAHHFALLGAWLLARTHGVPLLTTFHGPLLSGNRPNRAVEALGMTLAIHRGDAVSGVSEEVLEDLSQLGRPEARLLPNVVRFNPQPATPCFPPKRLLLITRREKLEHIRQGALLFSAYASRVRGAKLTVVDGDSAVGLEANSGRATERLRRATRQLGRKWLLTDGRRVIRHLPRIEFVGWTSDSLRLIRQADLVMGMGRVVLEAVSEDRPAVLIGYERTHGLLTAGRFDEFRFTNFSGRRCESMARDQIADSVAATAHSPDLATCRHLIDVAAQARLLNDELDRIAELKVSNPSDGVAKKLIEVIGQEGSDEEIVETAATMLTDNELETLHRLQTG